MSIRPKNPAIWLFGILVVALCIKFTVYAPLRLAWFAHRIAATDRIIATNWLASASGVSIAGDDAKRVVRAISSAGSGTPPFGTDWANIYDVKVRFYRGATFLGEIEMDGAGLFLLHHRPPFRDRTGLLHDLIYKPVSEAARTAELEKSRSP
jgi:hypothetical protein